MIHVCFTIHDESGTGAKFAGTAMLSVFENTNAEVTVHILHDDTLTDDNREKFSYLAGRCNQIVKFYNVEKICANKLEQLTKLLPNIDATPFHKTALYKFLIPQVLSASLDKAIYLESNLIVNLDVNMLWNVDIGEKILAAVPAAKIAADLPAQDKIVSDGLVNPKNYFSSGVLLMNLELLRDEYEKILEGLTLANKRKYFKFVDQTVLNYSFENQTLKLPTQFSCFVRPARIKKESVAKKIYCYTAYSLQLDTSDPFNRLWLDYFIKSPWFNAETFGKLFVGFQQVHVRLKKSMTNLAIALNGKTRGFCATPNYVDVLKKLFRVRNNEEFITLENQTSLYKLINAMKKSRGKKIFFVMAQDLPLSLLAREGFVFGADYLNALEFLSEEHGISMNAYPLIQAM